MKTRCVVVGLSVLVLSVILGCGIKPPFDRMQTTQAEKLVLHSIYKEAVLVSEIYWLKETTLIFSRFLPNSYDTNDPIRALMFTPQSSDCVLTVNALVISQNCPPILAHIDLATEHVGNVTFLKDELWQKEFQPSQDWLSINGYAGINTYHCVDGSVSPPMYGIRGFKYNIEGKTLNLSLKRYEVALTANGNFDFFISNTTSTQIQILNCMRFLNNFR